jgi:hypothetical protein
MVLNLNNKAMRNHSNWNRGIYLIEDLNFAKEFPKYSLRKIGYSTNMISRVKNLSISDNMKWRVLEDLGETFRHPNDPNADVKAEEKWESIFHKNILGKPFCSRWVIDKRFPFPNEFDDTTELLKQLYGDDIFEGWTNYMMHYKNRMFRYFLNIRNRMDKIKREQDPRLNWGATEWFIDKC